jgi:hypothetical protein
LRHFRFSSHGKWRWFHERPHLLAYAISGNPCRKVKIDGRAIRRNWPTLKPVRLADFWLGHIPGQGSHQNGLGHRPLCLNIGASAEDRMRVDRVNQAVDGFGTGNPRGLERPGLKGIRLKIRDLGAASDWVLTRIYPGVSPNGSRAIDLAIKLLFRFRVCPALFVISDQSVNRSNTIKKSVCDGGRQALTGSRKPSG